MFINMLWGCAGAKYSGRLPPVYAAYSVCGLGCRIPQQCGTFYKHPLRETAARVLPKVTGSEWERRDRTPAAPSHGPDIIFLYELEDVLDGASVGDQESENR